MTASPQITFYSMHGHTVIPAEGSIIRPRRSVYALAITGDLFLSVKLKTGKGFFELPGGGMETGETPEQTIAREWAEETGIPFIVEGPLKEHRFTRGHFAEDINEFWFLDQTYFLYRYLSTVEKDKAWVNPEGCETCWKSFSDIKNMRMNQQMGIRALIPDEVN